MGAQLSSTLYNAFIFVNDVHIAIGSGLLGLFLILYKGVDTEICRLLCISGITTISLIYACSSTELVQVSKKKIVFITGCDSGLGFSLAQHLCKRGFTVVAACLNLNSDGAQELRTTCNDIILIELDITQNESIENALKSLQTYLQNNETNELWALINNAGVMVFGEFEWLTERLIKHQLDVNLFGTMKLTKALLPTIRKYSSRIITITSHCANATLPGLSVYGATKAALSGWCDGLRVELKKYGVPVVKILPGSFVQQSNIMSRQNENVYEMQSEMTPEQLQFYDNYFKRYNKYLSGLSGERKPTRIVDQQLYQMFDRALLEKQPKATYLHECWKYKIYHFLFKIMPVPVRDYLIVYFVSMPKWESEKTTDSISRIIS